MTAFFTETLGWRFLLSLVISASLWARLTLEQNPQKVDIYPTDITVEPRGLPPNLVVANELAPVKVRVAAPQESWRFLEPSSFRVSVDLSSARPGLNQADVVVETPDPQVRTLEVMPAKLTVRVEELKTASIPVQVTLAGSMPFGFRAGDPIVSPSRVEVSGPSSAIERVNAAIVTLRLDEARSTIDRSLKPEPRGANGVISGVRVEPQNVTVTLPVEQIAGSKAVSVVPVVQGQPAPGYWQTSIAVDPSTVQIVGDPNVLDAVAVLNTAPIDVSGAQGEIVRTVPINRPQGVTVVRDLAATVRVGILPLPGQQVRDVAVNVANLSEGLAATVSPGTVSVSLSGPQPALARTGLGDVTVTIDAAGLTAGAHTRPVQVQAPDGVRVDRALPDQVTLTLAAR
ncbi:MAG TPA: CdaR family protein [Chloroflexota bacterium]|nr:CdaR family protein [Chloroflexota bacterium]